MVHILSMVVVLAGVWRSGDLPFGTIADIAAHPTIAGLVFASTASGIYRSTDSGAHWERVSEMTLYTTGFVPLHSLAFNPFNDHELCALGDSNGSCSADLGTTWTPFPQPGITFLLFDPRVIDRLFMGTVYGSDWIFVSDDHGRTWSARGLVEGHPWFHGAAAIEAASGAMFESASPHGGCIPSCAIFRSLDAGSTWKEIVPDQAAWTLATDRSRRSVLYAIVNGVLSASNDDGATWETRGAIPVVNGPIDVLGAPVDDPSIIYAGFDGAFLFRSHDGGRTWMRIDQSEIHDPPNERITHVSVGADGTVYAATDRRAFALIITRRRAIVHR